jgi:thiol-disulfide isomerase/thioredoxin
LRIAKTVGLLLFGIALGAGAGAAFWYAPIPGAAASQPPAPRTTPLTAAPAPVVDSPAPDFSLSDLTGTEVTLSGLRGKSVILNFWATWCEPCREELPLLDRIAREHQDVLTVIAVEAGEGETEIRRFVDPLGLTAVRILSDPSGRVRDDYLVRGLPTSFFLDSAGVIRRIKIGTMESAEIETILIQTGAMP